MAAELRYYNVEFSISAKLRDEIIEFFRDLEEFSNPQSLREFFYVEGLKHLRPPTFHSSSIQFDLFIGWMLKAGKYQAEPPLFSLLAAIAIRYKDDGRSARSEELKQRLNEEFKRRTDSEQGDYQRLAQAGHAAHANRSEDDAKKWIEEATGSLDELALRITLAVFNGLSFDWIERQKGDLFDMLKPLMPAGSPSTENSSNTHEPLMRRLRHAGAKEVQISQKAPHTVELEESGIAPLALAYVWQLYRENDWRQKLIDWLTSYAVNRPISVRERVAVAVGRLAAVDFAFVRDRILNRWVRAENHQSEYRAAVGMALGVLVREESWAAEVEDLLSEWSRSDEQAQRWAAARGYIYAGPYCRRVSEVIAAWRRIAASETASLDLQWTEDLYLRLTNPLHTSLVDAIARFFINVAQLPGTEQKRNVLQGILQELEDWIASDAEDRGLGLWVFTMLAGLIAPVEGEEDATVPVLLSLVGKEAPESNYRKRLGSLFRLMLSNADSILSGRELLCAWLECIDSLQTGPKESVEPERAAPFELRFMALMDEIAKADQTGGARARLVECLKDCSGDTAKRILLLGT
jgi:hypothetical protein